MTKIPSIPVPSSSPVRDTRLKARARGVWATLVDMAGPSLEVPSALDRLREELPDGQQAIRNALSSLEEYGYVRKRTQRDARGQICGTIWRLNPRPALEPEAEVGAAA